jgi:hypothetical protein
MQFVLTSLIGCAMLIELALRPAPAEAQLQGHGGPIRALAISADGATVLSGSFDTTAIRWSVRRNAAEQVLRLHDSAVNAVAILEDGRAITAGEDTRIAVWTPGKQEPDAILEGHKGPIVALAVSPDNTILGWRVARLGRTSAERQRDRLFAERQSASQRRIRCNCAHLAAAGTGSGAGRNVAITAQCSGGCPRRRNRYRRCRREGLFPVSGGGTARRC